MNGGWSKYNFKDQTECVRSLGTTSGAGSSDNSGKTVTSDPKPSGSAAGSASPSALDRPASREDCRNWSQYSNPSFKNQNECVSYVNKQSPEQKR